MPIIDCEKLLLAKKQMQPKILAEALVNHILPKLVDLENQFLERINKGLSAEVPIFSYQSTELLVNGSTSIESFFIDRIGPSRTVASLAYEACDHLPCGTAIGKAVSSWTALELLSTAIGPNIRVYKQRGEKSWSCCAEFDTYFYSLVARLEDKPLERSPLAVQLWPNAEQICVRDGVVCWDAPVEICTEEFDERQDEKCTFCGQMDSECGGDHGDEMREIMRARRGRW